MFTYVASTSTPSWNSDGVYSAKTKLFTLVWIGAKHFVLLPIKGAPACASVHACVCTCLLACIVISKEVGGVY